MVVLLLFFVAGVGVCALNIIVVWMLLELGFVLFLSSFFLDLGGSVVFLLVLSELGSSLLLLLGCGVQTEWFFTLGLIWNIGVFPFWFWLWEVGGLVSSRSLFVLVTFFKLLMLVVFFSTSGGGVLWFFGGGMNLLFSVALLYCFSSGVMVAVCLVILSVGWLVFCGSVSLIAQFLFFYFIFLWILVKVSEVLTGWFFGWMFVFAVFLYVGVPPFPLFFIKLYVLFEVTGFSSVFGFLVWLALVIPLVTVGLFFFFAGLAPLSFFIGLGGGLGVLCL